MADTDLHPIAALYDADILEWSEQQAELLRRRAAGEPVVIPRWIGRTSPRRSRAWAAVN
jgi:hypothetical protein